MSDEANLRFADAMERSGMAGGHFAAQAMRTLVDPEIAMNAEAQRDPYSAVMGGLGAASRPSASVNTSAMLPMPALMSETAARIAEGRMNLEHGVGLNSRFENKTGGGELDDLDAMDSGGRPELTDRSAVADGVTGESALLSRSRGEVWTQFRQPELSPSPLDTTLVSTLPTEAFIRRALGDPSHLA